MRTHLPGYVAKVRPAGNFRKGLRYYVHVRALAAGH